jgi:predicted DNA-binding transcriptional regulator AlpA
MPVTDLAASASANPTDDEVWTPKVCAELLHVHLATLARWRSECRGPRYLKIGPQSVRYRPEDVREWLAANVTDPTSVR